MKKALAILAIGVLSLTLWSRWPFTAKQVLPQAPSGEKRLPEIQKRSLDPRATSEGYQSEQAPQPEKRAGDSHLNLTEAGEKRPLPVEESLRKMAVEKGVSEEDADYVVKMYREGVESDVPINFYGKVTDRDGIPLPAVNIKLEVSGFDERIDFKLDTWWNNKRTVSELTSDTEGYFTITDAKGHYLTVVSLSKEGYMPHESQIGKTFTYIKYRSLIHTPDPEHPVVFKMWKLLGPEPIYHYKISTSVPCDGTPILFDLTRGDKVKSGGDIRISLLRTPVVMGQKKQKSDWNRKFDWTVSLEGIEGGMIESNDDFMYLAPEYGYLPRIDHQMLANDPHWTSEKRFSLYLKSRNGKHYGRVALNFRTDTDGGTAGLGIESYLNPGGSRNLEYDKTEQINTAGDRVIRP